MRRLSYTMRSVANVGVALSVALALAFGAREAMADTLSGKKRDCIRCNSQAECEACCFPRLGTCTVGGACFCD